MKDICEAIEKIERYIGGMDRDSFTADEKTIDAVVRNLEIIGEAARQTPQLLKKKYGCPLEFDSGIAQPDCS
jgi:uncharacterized protein with HEPN domain